MQLTEFLDTTIALGTAFVLGSLIGLEMHRYPIREIETLTENDKLVELAASLVPTSADPAELDRITDHISRRGRVVSVTWTVGTSA